jgi:hypothetical protein
VKIIYCKPARDRAEVMYIGVKAFEPVRFYIFHPRSWSTLAVELRIVAHGGGHA